MIRAGVLMAMTLVLAPAMAAGPATAQCLLANPSFEIAGSGGAVFGGWNQFGTVAATAEGATHGALAARVSGPDLGGWDVSGYWQALGCVPGQCWAVSARAWHTATRPLTGQAKAIVNIEWRDAGGGLIGYESHVAADAATPRGIARSISFQSGAAPAGTATARLLLGVLQGPTDPVPDAYYDEAMFESTGPPTIDTLQWSDFPGGRTLDFSGRIWRVKGPGYYGPGPNSFSDSAGATWVDESGQMHLTVQNADGIWYSTEVALAQPLGYGDYIFTTRGRLDTLHPNVVFGLFLWQYGRCWDSACLWWNPYNEIDIEFSRWGAAVADIAQFVAQPYDWSGNLHRFTATFSDGELTSHAFRWLPDRVEFRSWRGGPRDEAPATTIAAWTYGGPHLPRPEQPRVHLNLWQCCGAPSSRQEVVISGFTFVPRCLTPPCATGVAGQPPATSPAAALDEAFPNPFNPGTTIRFRAPAGTASLTVYDAAGRRVKTLLAGSVAPGGHEVVWDGRDAAGRPAPSGVYLYQLRAAGAVETRRMLLVR